MKKVDPALADELIALQAIYEDALVLQSIEESPAEAGVTGMLRLTLRLPSSITELRFDTLKHGNPTHTKISYLPPVQLQFHLPPGYPSVTSVPTFKVRCDWMPMRKLEKLDQEMQRIWREEGVECDGVVVYRMASFVEEDGCEVMELVDMSNQEPSLNLGFDPSSSSLSSSSFPALPASVSHLLTTYDLSKRRQYLYKTTVECPICFDTLPGRSLTLFTPCHHTFCTTCVTHFMASALHDSDIPRLGCLHPTCIALRLKPYTVNDDDVLGDAFERMGLERDVVEEVLGREGFEKVCASVLGRAGERMQGKVAMCPRVGCKGKMLRDVGGKVGVGGREEFGEKLCVCKECRYPFCFWCKSLWHGSQDCSIPAKDVADTLLRYTLGSELDRRRLAFLYGLNLENLITCAEKKMQEAQEVANANAAKASALLQQLTSSEMTVETTKSKSKHKSKVGEKKAEPCRDCNQTWKGRINRDTSALRDIVMGLQPQDDKLKTIFDEASSVIWVYENGSKCPGCGMGVHRVSGCYRILCSVCDCKFCYGCGAPLEHESPALFDENGYVPLD